MVPARFRSRVSASPRARYVATALLGALVLASSTLHGETTVAEPNDAGASTS